MYSPGSGRLGNGMPEYLWTPWRMTYIAGAGGSSGESATEEDGVVPSRKTTEGSIPSIITPQSSLLTTAAERSDCVFCERIGLPESQDRASLILLRADHNFVILNLYPYNSAHLMIVPYLHTADFVGLPPETLVEMNALAQRMVHVIHEEYHPQGFNLGMNLGRIAGAGVADHLHLHVVPRWAGDSNFMPIVGATKVMPELLETTYDRLKARLSKA
jgi:ATP adenylyltransferase